MKKVQNVHDTNAELVCSTEQISAYGDSNLEEPFSTAQHIDWVCQAKPTRMQAFCWPSDLSSCLSERGQHLPSVSFHCISFVLATVGQENITKTWFRNYSTNPNSKRALLCTLFVTVSKSSKQQSRTTIHEAMYPPPLPCSSQRKRAPCSGRRSRAGRPACGKVLRVTPWNTGAIPTRTGGKPGLCPAWQWQETNTAASMYVQWRTAASWTLASLKNSPRNVLEILKYRIIPAITVGGPRSRPHLTYLDHHSNCLWGQSQQRGKVRTNWCKKCW